MKIVNMELYVATEQLVACYNNAQELQSVDKQPIGVFIPQETWSKMLNLLENIRDNV